MRWWIYQKERFPVVVNGCLIAVFSTSAVGYSLLLRAGEASQSGHFGVGAAVLSFIALFLFFLQLRIADEFREIQADVLYHPYRPVPRGLVSLTELRWIGLAGGLVQFGLAVSVGLPMLLLLAVGWGYLGLMTRAFFVPRWLKAHPLLALLSRAAIMPMLAFYATAHDWLVVGAVPVVGLIWFLLISLLNGLMLELMLALRRERTHKEATGIAHSNLWEYRKAGAIWLTLAWLLTLTTLQASVQINFALPVTIVALLLLTGSIFVIWRFWVKPTFAAINRVELITVLWAIGGYFNLGILPLLLRR